MKTKSSGQEYLDSFPKLKKWINECICCHRQGYKPDMPEQISVVEGSLHGYMIKKYYSPLSLDENEYCEICANLMNK